MNGERAADLKSQISNFKSLTIGHLLLAMVPFLPLASFGQAPASAITNANDAANRDAANARAIRDAADIAAARAIQEAMQRVVNQGGLVNPAPPFLGDHEMPGQQPQAVAQQNAANLATIARAQALQQQQALLDVQQLQLQQQRLQQALLQQVGGGRGGGGAVFLGGFAGQALAPEPGVSPEQQYRMDTLATQLASTVLSQQRQTIVVLAGGGFATINASSTLATPASSFAVPEAEPSLDVLDLADGGSLSGTLKQLDPAKLEWATPSAQSPIVFKTDFAESIHFSKFQPVTRTDKPTGWFQFQNGDEVWGNLESLDRTTAEIETPFGGRIGAGRNTLRTVAFGWEGLGTLYEGPNGTDGWNTLLGGWTFQGGEFVGRTTLPLGRNLGLSGSSSVAFDVGWNAGLGLAIQLYAPAFNQFSFGQASYVFLLVPGLVRAQRVQPNQGLLTLGDARIADMYGKRRARIELRTDAVNGTITLLADGRQLKEWKDEIPFNLQGTGIIFQSLLYDAPLSIGNIKVTQWGKTAPAVTSRETLAADQVAVRFANRDEIKGRMPLVNGGVFKVSSTPAAALEFPMTRVSQLVFSSADAKPSAPASVVRADVAGGAVVSMDLENWSEEKLSGRSDTFGQLALDARNVRQLSFHRSASRNSYTDLDFASGGSSLGLGTDSIAPDDLLQLKNGGRLRGLFGGFGSNEVRWSAPQILGAVNFLPGTVSAVQLGQRVQPPSSPKDQWRVRLTTGDQLDGSIEQLGTNSMLLRTWYAGDLEIPISRIQRISQPPAVAPAKFEGPTGLDRWTMGSITLIPDGGEWIYRDGAFYAGRAASIARDVGLPDTARIEWDLRWSDTMYLAVALYTDRVAPIDLQKKEEAALLGGFYSLQLHGPSGSVKLLAITRGGNSTNTVDLGQTLVSSLIRTNGGHFELLVNKPQRKISLIVDGLLRREWVDPNGFAGVGTGIRFVHQGEGALKLSGLRVSEWDGRADPIMVSTYVSTELPDDRLRLMNDEEIRGDFRGVVDGMIRFELPTGGSTNAPLSQLKSLDFAGSKLNLEKPTNDTARAYFPNGNTIQFVLENWQADQIKARHAVLGSAVFRRAAFKRVEFF